MNIDSALIDYREMSILLLSLMSMIIETKMAIKLTFHSNRIKHLRKLFINLTNC